jgi:hypothetical protein
VPLFVVGLVALMVVAAAPPWSPPPPENSLDRDLAAVRQALKKPGSVEAILATAENAVARANQQHERVGEAHYLLGNVYLRLAERSPADRSRGERDKAMMHLEHAEHSDGVPVADKARLQYLRGKLLVLSGGDPHRAIELLSKSLPDGADNPAEGYGLLVQAHLRIPAPDLDSALAALIQQLAVCEDETTRIQAQMLRGELLLKKEQRAEAIKVFDSLGPKAPLEIRLKARYLQAQAAMQEGWWGRAIPWWQELLGRPDFVSGGKGRIYYNIGLCCLYFEPPAHEQDAVAAWQEAQLYGGEEAQAAALKLAELRLYTGVNQVAALEHFKQALDKVVTAGEYKNTLVDARKARELLEDACRIFNEREDHDHFLQAAELYKKLAPPGAAEEKVGQAAEGRGRDLLERARKQPTEFGLLEQARTALHQAALAYERAAESRPPVDRLAVLWRCVECYQLASEPVPAIAVLKKYVELPASPERKAEAWYVLAEMQRLLKLAEARDSYKQCVAYNNADFTSRALLNLADMAIDGGDLKDAQGMLELIVAPPWPIVDRPAHEQAFWKLASLYFQTKQFDKSALRCRELIKQYPAHPNLMSVREQLAECYRKLAEQALANAEGPEVVPADMKQHYRRQWQEYLEAARDTYQQLADDLDTARNLKKLTAAEETLRRKAYFVVADCYFDLPNWFPEAFRRYHELFEAFRTEPEGLWACQRLYLCLYWAENTRYDQVEAVRERAESAVEYCLRHLDEYAQAGAFRNPDERVIWQDWLEKVRESLTASRRMGG